MIPTLSNPAFLALIVLVSAIAVTYIGYPILVWLLSRLVSSPQSRNGQLGPEIQSATVIICAYNEASCVGEKLQSVLAQNWSGSLQVILADDGSTDGTIETALAAVAGDPRLEILTLSRSGKASALNAAVAKARGEVLVFSDADPVWRDDTLHNLLAPLRDPSIGSVAGNVITSKKASSSPAWFDRIFRSYETAIRIAENRLGGCTSADGGLFALRTSLFQLVPAGVTDDFFISTSSVEAGKRIHFEPTAIAIEHPIQGESKNFRRRVRITVRGLASVWRRKNLLNPFAHGFYSVALLFHKILRRFASIFIVATLPALVLIGLDYPVFLAAGAMEGGLFLAALAAYYCPQLLGPLRKPALAALHILGMAWGATLFMFGKRFEKWTPLRDANGPAQ